MKKKRIDKKMKSLYGNQASLKNYLSELYKKYIIMISMCSC